MVVRANRYLRINKYELNVKIQVNIDRYKLDGYKYKCKEYRKVA